MSFLLDTDICSAYVKNDRLVVNRFVQYGGRLYISTVTVDLLKEVQVIVVDESVAQKFGEIRAALLDAGQAAPPMDMMNAATALVHNLTLVTHNVADYANVPALTVADWMVP